VVTSAVTGVLAAAAAWFAAGERLPLGVDEALLTDWPRLLPVLVAEALVVAILAAGVAAGGWWQRHVIRRHQEVS
jgi:putative ABC transport system permease protein